jgi:peroxiredoxin Q/BCP
MTAEAKDPLQGKRAPAFTASTNGGAKLRLSELQGGPVVLYFYPKDETPGCTTEAKDFTALATKFKKLGVTVVGVSPDTAAKHDKFIDKHDLKLTLVSDQDKAICEKYGVWQEKKNYGRTYMGVVRSTFLIDASGKVAQVWRNIRVKGHAEKVLEAAKLI